MSSFFRRSWQSPAKRICLILISTAIVMGMISLYSFLTQERRAVASIFYLSMQDSYMDFFNCIWDGADLNIYRSAQSSLYPPLANLMYYGLGRMIPSDLLSQGAYAMKESAEGMRLFWAFQGGITLFFLLMLAYAFPGKWKEKLAVFLAGAVSMPILFVTERGNCLPLAAGLVIVYLLWMDHESPVKRELAFLALAAAANLKMYPALFGLLLLTERRWKEAVRLMVYGLLMFFLPMMIYGLKSCLYIANNLRYLSQVQTEIGLGYKVGWTNCFHLISELTGLPLMRWLSWLIMLLCAVSLWKLKDRGSRVMMIVMMCIGFPDFSMVYNTLFYFLTLIIFAKEDHITPARTVTIIIMSVSLFPLAVGGGDPFYGLAEGTWLRLNWTTLIDCVTVMILTATNIVTAFKEWPKEK